MKYQRQGKGECLLATIAMLSKQSIETVRARASELTGYVNWYDWLNAVEGEIKAIHNEASYHYNAVNLTHYNEILHSYDEVCRTLCEESGIPHIGGMVETLIIKGLPKAEATYDLSGRGEIVICGVVENKPFVHSMAYEDGLVFDPQDGREEGEPLEQVLARLVPGTRVVRITPVPPIKKDIS